MKKSQRGFIVPLLLATIAILLVGSGSYLYMQNKSENQTPLVTEIPKATSTTQTSPSQTAGWKTYSNSEYGFEIEMPPSWDSYQTNVKKLSDGSVIIGFNLPYTLNGIKTYYKNALVISLYPVNVWQTIKYPDGSKPLKLGEDSTYVYSYSQGQDLGGTSELEKAGKDINKIISTFKLN